MQEEEVDMVEAHAREALLEAADQIAFDRARLRRAEAVLGGHPDTVRQPSAGWTAL